MSQPGKRKRDGSLTPDTWRVIEHEEYAKTHPGLCPPFEYAPDFEAAQAAGVLYGQRLRESEPIPENLFKLNTASTKAIADFLTNLTDEDREEITAHLKTRTAEDFMPFALPVPNNRARQKSGQSLTLGTGPVANDDDCRSLSSGLTSP
jgi:hypothetical protein